MTQNRMSSLPRRGDGTRASARTAMTKTAAARRGEGGAPVDARVSHEPDRERDGGEEQAHRQESRAEPQPRERVGRARTHRHREQRRDAGDDDRVPVRAERVPAEVDEDVAPRVQGRGEVDERQVVRPVPDLAGQLERRDQHPVEREQHDQGPRDQHGVHRHPGERRELAETPPLAAAHGHAPLAPRAFMRCAPRASVGRRAGRSSRRRSSRRTGARRRRPPSRRGSAPATR